MTIDAAGAPATTIDEVVSGLDEVVAWALSHGSAAGYFAAMYRRVTLSVREDLPTFDDPDRMARLDVVFANRYLAAFAAWRAGREPSHSWQLAFAATGDRRAVILQHLLLGMNAHINLDLAVAASEVAPGAAIGGLQGDFDRINTVLAGLVDADRLAVEGLSPRIRVLDRFSKRDDEMIRFAIGVARDQAWRAAERLARLSDAARPGAIAELDRWVSVVGAGVRRPPLPLGPVLRHVVWPAEVHEPGRVIAALA